MRFFGQNIRGSKADGETHSALPPFVKGLLPVALADLMFFIIPIPGMEFRLSWQLAAIWLAGLALTAFLSGWLIRLFWIDCLIVTAWYLPPNYAAYIALLSVAIFLAAAEGFKRIDIKYILAALRIAALSLIVWIILQQLGVVPTWFAPRNAGPFNPDAGGCLLAMCLPAFMTGGWWLLTPVIVYGLIVTKTTTAFLAVIAALAAYWFAAWRVWKRDGVSHIICRNIITGTVIAAVFVVAAWGWINHVRPDQKFIGSQRLIAWQYAAKHIAVEPLGRGLASWEAEFPFMAAGVKPINTPVGFGKDYMPPTAVMMQAHNEYVQIAFEAGIQSLILIMAFMIITAVCVWRGLIWPPVAAGVVSVAVCCAGFHVLHIEPTAIIGMAWLGLLKK